MTDTNQLPPLPTPKFTETVRGVPCITVTEHEHLIRAYALQARAQVQGEPSWWMRETDEGVEWTDTAPLVLSGWTPLYTAPQPAQATQAEVTGEREAFESCTLMEGSLFKRRADDPDKYWDGNVQDDWELWQARAILALRPQQSGLTGCNCRWDGGTQVQWCELHLANKDAIHEWAERAKEAEKQLTLRPERVPMTDEQIRSMCKQGWVFETVRQWVHVIEAHHGITAQAKKEVA